MATGALDFPAHPFWDWSLKVYRRDGVAAACVGLQDRHGLDVNVLLYALWRATRTDRPLDAAGLDTCDATVKRWREEVVRPLRAVRRGLKGRSDAPVRLSEGLRARFQGLEIDAEHIQQLMLAVTGPAAETPAGSSALRHAAAGAARCLLRLGARPDAADRARLATIVAATLHDVTAEAVDNALVVALAPSPDSS